MKNLFLVLLVGCVSFSCSKDKSLNSGQYPQKWILVKMTGQTLNSEQTGVNMEWQEYYLLKADGTFTKFRKRDGIEKEASGNFILNEKSNEKFLEFTFNTNSDIIGSCSGTQTESLWLKSDNKLVGTWSYCDGPGLEYEREE